MRRRVELCPTCRGSSYVGGDDCPTCGGTGVRPAKVLSEVTEAITWIRDVHFLVLDRVIDGSITATNADRAAAELNRLLRQTQISHKRRAT